MRSFFGRHYCSPKSHPIALAAVALVALIWNSLAFCGTIEKAAEKRTRRVEKSTDQALLAKIAAEDTDENVRYAAAGRIQDVAVLQKIADNDKKQNQRSRTQTIVLLRKLMAGSSDILQRPVWISLRVNDLSHSYAPNRTAAAEFGGHLSGHSVRR